MHVEDEPGSPDWKRLYQYTFDVDTAPRECPLNLEQSSPSGTGPSELLSGGFLAASQRIGAWDGQHNLNTGQIWSLKWKPT